MVDVIFVGEQKNRQSFASFTSRQLRALELIGKKYVTTKILFTLTFFHLTFEFGIVRKAY